LSGRKLIAMSSIRIAGGLVCGPHTSVSGFSSTPIVSASLDSCVLEQDANQVQGTESTRLAYQGRPIIVSIRVLFLIAPLPKVMVEANPVVQIATNMGASRLTGI